MSEPRVRHVVGCMTGTSLDGLDAALVRITGTGLDMSAEFVGMVSEPLGDLADELRSFTAGDAHPPLAFMRVARRLGELHADAAERLLHDQPSAEPRANGVDFIVAHGQTIWHAPAEHLSWQLFDPWPLVKRLGAPVCYDLRQADLIAGGEGAPITPLADWVMYREHADAVVNLGGVANVTVLHREPSHIKGGDVAPCNILIDGLARRLFDVPCDFDGKLSGDVDWDATAMSLVAEAICDLRDEHRSMGREQFHDAWLEHIHAIILREAAPAIALRSAIHAVALLVLTEATDMRKRNVVLAGGGARNSSLVEEFNALSLGKILLSDDLGIPCEAREAMGFAVLGALAQDGVDVTLPQVTGRGAERVPRAGAWVYPE